MKRMAYLFLATTLMIFLLSWTGCGSSRKTVNQDDSASQESSQDDFDEIEKLLGISRSKDKPADSGKQQTESTQPAEKKQQDDLITLLEVDEGKKSESTQTSGTPGEDKRVVRLQNQVDDLQQEIEKKNMEIADLKAQLMMKEENMQKQQSQAPATSYNYSQSQSRPASGTSQNVSSDSYVTRYDQALELFHERQYQRAIDEFQQLLSIDMNHRFSDNAQYWIGECYYALGRYQEAIMAFEKVSSFPKSNKNDWAKFKLGQSYFQLGNKERAQQEFQELLDLYPDSELVPRARNYLAQAESQ